MAISATRTEATQRAQAQGSSPAASRSAPRFRIRFGRAVKPRELIYFTSQLALMLEVGTPVTTCLSSLAKQTRNASFRRILGEVGKDVEEGRQFSDALMRHPDVFDGTYMSMVKAGETGGFLTESLGRLVVVIEKKQELVTQIRSALTYPAALCVMAFSVVIFIVVAVLPKFTAFFEGKEHLLPGTTRFLMAASSSIRAYWGWYIVGTVVLVTAIKLFVESGVGRLTIDTIAVKSPIGSGLANKINTCSLLRTLGHLLESQVPLIEALGVTRTTMRNRYYQRLVDRIEARVTQGGRLSAAFVECPYVVESVRQMVATGEEAGNLYPVMLRLAEHYDKEVDQELRTFSALIEPVALIVLGTIVAVIVSSIMLPMFKLAYAVH